MKRRIRPSGSSRKASSLNFTCNSFQTFSFMKCQDQKPFQKAIPQDLFGGHHGLCRPRGPRCPPGRFRIDSFADSGSPSTSLLWSKQPATHAASRGHGCRFDGVASSRKVLRIGGSVWFQRNGSSTFLLYPDRFVFFANEVLDLALAGETIMRVSSWVLVALGNRSLN